MPNAVDHQLKLIVGDLVLTVARLSAENAALREQLAVARATAAPPTEPQP